MRRRIGFLLALAMTALGVVGAESAPLSPEAIALIDSAVTDAIRNGETPGAVILVGQGEQILFRKAYGFRSVQPGLVPMTPDTIFDLASLTKVVATAPVVMWLVERGMVRLDAPLAHYLPEFAFRGKGRITIRQLLTHFSGMRADPRWNGGRPGRVVAQLARLPLLSTPGHRFLYSDVNFILLSEMVRRVSGKSLDRLAHQVIFQPLGMADTMFNPPPHLIPRIAPTEVRDGRWLRGKVHDTNAYLMGGSAGHAGLFGTADDLARFSQMVLNGGRHGGVQVFKEATIQAMISPYGGKHDPVLRGLGWDMQSPFSGEMGRAFPQGSFGHTGFTGTSIWLEPRSKISLIILTNRVHPDGRGDIRALRGYVAAAVAATLDGGLGTRASVESTRLVPSPIPGQVLTGLDLLVEENFRPLEGKRVGLVTNHTAVDRRGRSAVELFAQAKSLRLVALFSPEHGIAGTANSPVAHGTDPLTGLPVWSLYGESRRPTREMLQGIDALVFDIQDIGVRYYTYISTLGLVMEEAARYRIPVYVLDRPNPLTGVAVEGPLIDPDLTSFTGYHPLPIRHGMTVGELALMFNAERGIGADLTVIPMRGWRRDQWYDATGLYWINPSPNIRSLTQALLYSGIGFLEATNLSVGRGTDKPFELLGAPWVDGMALARELNARRLPGVRFVPVRFIPQASIYAGQSSGGVNVILTDRDQFQPVATGLEIAAILQRLYPGTFEGQKLQRLLANRQVMAALTAATHPRFLGALVEEERAEFLKRRAPYLLYGASSVPTQ